MTAPYTGPEKRSNRLTADEVEDIAGHIMDRIIQGAENIGYDISTPEARAEINKDHQWVRSWRTGAGSAQKAAMGVSVTTILGGIFWILWYGAQHLLSTGK